MVEQHIKTLLPAATLAHLQQWFTPAHSELSSQNAGLSNWPNKVRMLPQGLLRKPPVIAPLMQAAISQALLNGCVAEVSYQASGAGEPWTRVIHPLAMIVRNRVVYVTCVYQCHADIRHLVLHRMTAAKVLDQPVVYLPGFDVDAEIANGEFGLPMGQGTLMLEAWFEAHLALYLRESPISNDQTLSEPEDDWVCLHATLTENLELRLWFNLLVARLR